MRALYTHRCSILTHRPISSWIVANRFGGANEGDLVQATVNDVVQARDGFGTVARSWAGRVIALVAFVVIFGPMLADASTGVWTSAFALGLAFAPTAVGVYLTFRILDFPDLTVDASFPAGGAIAAVTITNGLSPWLALVLAMLVGGALGALTGLLHLGLRINSLLASILTVTAAFTINLRIQGRSNIPLLGTDSVYTPFTGTIKDVMEGWWGAAGVSNHRNVTTALIAGGILVAIWVLTARFLRTEVGIGLRSTGNNPKMSNAQGIDTRLYLIGGVSLSNALVALSGALVAQHQGFADVNSGAGLIIAGLAAVIIGEVLFGGNGKSIGRLLVAASLGMIIYRTAIAIALASDVDLPGLEPIQLAATDVRLATALIVGLLLAIPRVRESRQRKSRQRRKVAQ